MQPNKYNTCRCCPHVLALGSMFLDGKTISQFRGVVKDCLFLRTLGKLFSYGYIWTAAWHMKSGVGVSTCCFITVLKVFKFRAFWIWDFQISHAPLAIAKCFHDNSKDKIEQTIQHVLLHVNKVPHYCFILTLYLIKRNSNNYWVIIVYLSTPALKQCSVRSSNIMKLSTWGKWFIQAKRIRTFLWWQEV